MLHNGIFLSLMDPWYFINSKIFRMKFVSFFPPSSISSFGYLYYLWLWILNCHNGLDYWWHWWNFYQLRLRKCWNFFSCSIVAFLLIQSVWTIICKLPSESRGVGDICIEGAVVMYPGTIVMPRKPVRGNQKSQWQYGGEQQNKNGRLTQVQMARQIVVG